jgi:hypothetical protein
MKSVAFQMQDSIRRKPGSVYRDFLPGFRLERFKGQLRRRMAYLRLYPHIAQNSLRMSFL